MHELPVEFSAIPMVILFGLIQGLLVLYLFTTGKRYKRHWPFVLLVILLMFAQMEAFALHSGLMAHYPHLINISTPLIFLLGPALYEYVKLQLDQYSSTKEKILHAVPFLLYLGYSFNFFLQPTTFKFNAYVNAFRPEWPSKSVISTFSSDPWDIQGWVVVELLTLHILLYALVCFYLIFRFIKQNTGTHRIKSNWLLYLTGLITLGGLMLFFSEGGVINGKVFFKSPFPHFSVELFSTIAMYLTTIYIIGKSELFKSKEKKYNKSTLSIDFKKKKMQQLRRIMEEERPYLSPNFSLNKLADISGLSKHHISQILNEDFQCNFYQLTNSYRIEEAKKRLCQSEGIIKIEQLAYELGYKSKSTFFNAFKRATNVTPSKYRDLTAN